jgi:uncharacterized membrane protein YoaK (UPF0700 family)
MLMPKINNRVVDWPEVVGVVLGLIVGGVVSILLSAWVIHWILTGIGIGALTYGQVVGLLAIWEIVKPRTETK